MLTSQIIYWRDIPAQVQVFQGRRRISRPLSDRFQVAIDAAAMNAGATESDAYLEQWRHSEPQACKGEPETVAAALVGELELEYPPERLQRLVANGAVE